MMVLLLNPSLFHFWEGRYNSSGMFEKTERSSMNILELRQMAKTAIETGFTADFYKAVESAKFERIAANKAEDRRITACELAVVTANKSRIYIDEPTAQEQRQAAARLFSLARPMKKDASK